VGLFQAPPFRLCGLKASRLRSAVKLPQGHAAQIEMIPVEGGLRERVHSFCGSYLIISDHPAYLLRDSRQKKEAWADLQIAMRELDLKPSGRG